VCFPGATAGKEFLTQELENGDVWKCGPVAVNDVFERHLLGVGMRVCADSELLSSRGISSKAERECT